MQRCLDISSPVGSGWCNKDGKLVVDWPGWVVSRLRKQSWNYYLASAVGPANVHPVPVLYDLRCTDMCRIQDCTNKPDDDDDDKGILLSTPKRFTKVTMGDRSFQAAAPRLWNSLPISIRSACTKMILNRNLGHFYLTRHFAIIKFVLRFEQCTLLNAYNNCLWLSWQLVIAFSITQLLCLFKI